MHKVHGFPYHDIPAPGILRGLPPLPVMDAQVGDDVTEKLGVRHYDEISAPFIPVKVPCGDKLSDFPFWIPKLSSRPS